eukprot:CAMPEP_0116572366 /NCGR_PEP_ID=MMETSP0397-20121206/18126_1 /TAXON_ID=216820 /ORGANISM="Cyclophora tenuis, Strain ECT3854" /LENGTH=203 /DNA_ID=CAMNT_0004100667 /DNA_START=61 /DNA_END=672 /DNA_ORIENTATION=-
MTQQQPQPQPQQQQQPPSPHGNNNHYHLFTGSTSNGSIKSMTMKGSSSSSSSSSGGTPKKSDVSPRVKLQMEKHERELDQAILKWGPDHPAVAKVLGTLGLLNQHMTKNTNKAITYHEEAIRILRKSIDANVDGGTALETLKEQLAVALTDLALIHEQTADFQHALDEYTEARQILQSINRNKSDPRFMSSDFGVDRISRAMK